MKDKRTYSMEVLRKLMVIAAAVEEGCEPRRTPLPSAWLEFVKASERRLHLMLELYVV